VKQRGVRANFLFNMGGMAIPVVVSLVTIPIFIHHIGEARYGVMSIVWLLLGYFGFLDFGLARASANTLAKLGDAQAEVRGRVIASAFYLNAGLGLVGAFAIFLAGGLLFRDLFGLPADIWQEMHHALPFVGGMLPLALVSGVGLGALESRERFLLANILQTVGTAAGQIIPALCAVYWTPDLSVLLPLSFSVRFLSVLAIFAMLARHERLRLYRFDRALGRRLFGYGAWVSVSNIISPILTSLDQFLIGAKLGAAMVPFYSVPMGLSSRVQIVAGALARAVFPRLSRYERLEAVQLTEQSIITLAYVFGGICAMALFLVHPFFTLWISADFASKATLVGQVLILGSWINGLALIALSLIQGQGRPDLAAKVHTAELLPFVGLLWLMIHEFGLVGAAIAWTIRVTVDALLLFWLGGLRLMPMMRVLPAALLLLLACGGAVFWQTMVPAALGLAVGGGLVFALTGLLMDKSLRRLVRRLSQGRFGMGIAQEP
jgi:O-antigen/teichoic acid export membrane protein